MKRFTWTVVFVVLTISIAMGFALTKIRSAAISNSTLDSTPIGNTTPSTGIFTDLTVNTGIARTGTGVKHITVASCTTAALVAGSCNTLVTWPGSPFPDTNYTVDCSLNDAVPGGAAMVYGTGLKTTTTVTVGLINTGPNNSAANGQVNCIAFHDP